MAVMFLLLLQGLVLSGAQAQPPNGQGEGSAAAQYWTAERRAAAVPRDLVIDRRGLGYLRAPNGSLRPYGHSEPAVVTSSTPGAALIASPLASPSPVSAPRITDMDPGAGEVIGSAHVFRAKVTDPDGLRSVTFVLHYPDGRSGKFSASRADGDFWNVSFSGFWEGNWAWHVEAKDRGPKGGAVGVSPRVDFTVSVGSTAPADGSSRQWTGGGDVQTAIGRIFFEMPNNRRQSSWSGYVCSGTAVTDDAANGKSLILTAAHCIYDDVNKAFARNVLFIPDQANGGKTNRVCSDDPMGCWAPDYGVVDTKWTQRRWPDNIPWDYGFYVVPASGKYTAGVTTVDESLESAVPTLGVQFSSPDVGAVSHALGYPYDKDPELRYCAEAMGTNGASNWWLPSCDMTGGSSGGPWIQPMRDGTGPVISVNSWGYSNSPGMAGPRFSGTSAECVFSTAQGNAPPRDRGVMAPC
jgi:hypothetical protein